MKTITSDAPLVLASGSRFRRELLERLGLPFITMVPNVDEMPYSSEPPAETALRLAEAKAREVGNRFPSALVIGSDQVANFEGKVIGKPIDRNDAIAQLKSMRGRTIVFHTALTLLNTASGRCQRALIDVASTFRSLDDSALEAYVDRDQPYDCAGSVKAESLGIALFSRIGSDDPTALIGLPLIRLTDMLIMEGVHPL
jgi:septum formation protein